MPSSDSSQSSLLRALPAVDQLLRTPEAELLRDMVGTPSITRLARSVTNELRREIQAGTFDGSGAVSSNDRESLLAEALRRLDGECKRARLAGIRRVINATGVIIHTNLGRAPLSGVSRAALAEAAGYCTIEFDVTTGARGKRGGLVEDLLIELTGAEDALVVNNCAAAALLILTALAKDGETIVSRGELVEIGGDFRVPDVMANSGTQMIEVGTTNRTKLIDYSRAFNDRTRLIMRVHQSNYRIVGFTSAPTINELSALAHEAGLTLYVDAGSGALVDLGAYGLGDEPVISECIAHGADVVSFSGDKLIGGPQAGVIVGRRELIGRLRKHPLCRALRADKLSLAVLEATLEAHRRGAAAVEVPVLRMLAQTQAEIEARARGLIENHRQQASSSRDLNLEIIDGVSAIGGGCGPDTNPPTALIALHHAHLTAVEIEQRLRSSAPHIASRIGDDRVLLDLRTVDPTEEASIITALMALS